MSQPKGNKRGPYKKRVKTDYTKKKYIPTVGDMFRTFVLGKDYEKDIFGNDCTGLELHCSPQVAIEPPEGQRITRECVFAGDYRYISRRFNFERIKT